MTIVKRGWRAIASIISKTASGYWWPPAAVAVSAALIAISGVGVVDGQRSFYLTEGLGLRPLNPDNGSMWMNHARSLHYGEGHELSPVRQRLLNNLSGPSFWDDQAGWLFPADYRLYDTIYLYGVMGVRWLVVYFSPSHSDIFYVMAFDTLEITGNPPGQHPTAAVVVEREAFKAALGISRANY